MSEAYFPNQTDTMGGQQVAGFPSIPQQRTYDYGQPHGEQIPNGYPGPGHHSAPPGSPHPPAHPGGPVKQQPPRSVLAVIAVLVGLTLALGGYSVVTHGNLGDAESKADGLSTSLSKANDSLGSTQAELEKAKQDLVVSQQATADTAAALEVTHTCATHLMEAWTAYFNEDIEGASAALEAAEEPCGQALGDGSGQV